MFTPQKVWSGWSLTPKTGGHKSGTGSHSNQNSIGDGAKGKAIASGEAASPPGLGFAVQNYGNPLTGWSRRDRDRISELENELNDYQYEMGRLLIELKQRTSKYDELKQKFEAVSDRDRRISELENELCDYQYEMGRLLIELKQRSSKYDELKQKFEAVSHRNRRISELENEMGHLLKQMEAWTSKNYEFKHETDRLKKELYEAKDSLRREQAAHLIALADVEKREENLRKVLECEKQCVLDLEMALREIHAKHSEHKNTADSMMAETNALEKSLELEANLCAADAKLAEMSRNGSEIEWKQHGLEARESSLRRQSNLSKQEEELRESERKLQEGEERLGNGQEILNQIEERANENDRILKQTQKDLEDAQKIDEIED